MASPNPIVGYSPRGGEPGYLEIIRCRNTKTGLYLSLNGHCESAADEFYGSPGRVRAAEVATVDRNGEAIKRNEEANKANGEAITAPVTTEGNPATPATEAPAQAPRK